MTDEQSGPSCDKPTCSAKTRGGGACGRPAGWGTETPGYGRCKLHGGMVPNQIKHVQTVRAAQAVATYGIKSDLPPTAALLEEAQWSHGHVVWLRDVVQMIDPDALVWGVTEEHEKTASEFPGVDVKRMATPNVWLELYHKERRLHLDLVKTIETLKLEQRWQDIANRYSGFMGAVIRRGLARRGVVLDDAELAELVQEEIREQAGGSRVIEGRVA